MEEQVAAGISPLIISRVSRVIIYSTLKTAYRRSKDIKKENLIQFHQSLQREKAMRIKGRKYATLGGKRQSEPTLKGQVTKSTR